MMDTFKVSERNQSLPLPAMAADVEDKHLIAHLISIGLTIVQESCSVFCRTFVANREITSEALP
jgi:hypothetical protein